MTDKEKKVIFTIIAILVIILIIVICVKFLGKGSNNTVTNQSASTTVQNDDEKYTTKLDDGTKLNDSENLKKAKTYKTVEISDIQITSKNGDTTILANAKNTGTTKFEREEITLTLLGDNGEVITTIPATIPETEVGKTTQIISIISSDVANIKDFTIKAR